jgi:hypothetical protein
MGKENIHIKLAKFGLKIIVNCFYNLGDCLFNAIAYSLKYIETSKSIRKNNMLYLKICLNIGTPEVIECCRRELTFEFLFDLHGGQTNAEDSYITKTSMSTCDGGLWGYFTTIFWLS